MCNTDFWEHIKAIVSGGFTPEGLAELDEYADKFTCGQLLYKRFHRQNSMAVQREAMRMSLHPYSREQKLAQIQSLKEKTTSKDI